MRNTINSDTITAAILWGMGNLIMLFLINELTQRIEDFAALSTVDVAKMLALAGVFFFDQRWFGGVLSVRESDHRPKKLPCLCFNRTGWHRAYRELVVWPGWLIGPALADRG